MGLQLELETELEGTGEELEGNSEKLEGACEELEGTGEEPEGSGKELEGTGEELEGSIEESEDTSEELEGTTEEHGVQLPEKPPKMSGSFLCKSMDRSVEIRITNKIQNITLHSPRSFCFSGYNSIPPSPCISTGVTESCHFSNSFLKIRGCVGLLVYEADTFTLAILFSNPSNYSFYPIKLAMEISLLKVHLSDLEDTYTRMYEGKPATTDKNTGYHCVKLGTCQEPVTVSAGHVRVTATMSSSTKSIVKVILENQESSPHLNLGGQHLK